MCSKITTHIVSLFTSAYVFYWSQYFPSKALLHPPSFDGRLVQYPSSKEVRDYFAWRQADSESLQRMTKQPRVDDSDHLLMHPMLRSSASSLAHINNLYNTTFWALVLLSRPQLTEAQAHAELKGTVSSQKNEILFSRFGINYEKEEAIFRKGSTLVWTEEEEEVEGKELPPTSSPDADHASQSAASTTTAPEEGTSDVQQQKMTQAGDVSIRTPNAKSKKKKRRLRTLHVDIISDSFWTPSKARSSTAHSDHQPQNVEPRPWQMAERLQGQGMGRWALA